MVLLEELAEIRSGHPFKSRITPHHDIELKTLMKQEGSQTPPVHKEVNDQESAVDQYPALVVQMKDLKSNDGIHWQDVLKTRISTRSKAHWLEPGQILFQPNGEHFGAFYLKEVPYPTLASPHLFIIKSNKPESFRPDFLAWQINQEFLREKLKSHAEGRLQMSLKKTDLAKLELILPAPKVQKELVELNELLLSEERLQRALSENRRKTLSLMLQKLYSENGTMEIDR